MTLRPVGPEIRAVIHFTPYTLPPDIRAAYSAVRDAEKKGINEVLSSFFKDAYSKHAPPVPDLQSALAEAIDDAWIGEFEDRVGHYGGFTRFVISNSGNRRAEEVVLDIPIDGMALITSEDKKERVVKVENVVNIGSIRPGNEVSVALWSSIDIWPWKDEVKLTHSSGTGTVAFPTEVFGFRAFVARNLGLIALTGTILVPWAVIVVLALISIFKKAAAVKTKTVGQRE